MTVNVSKPAVNLREELASLRNQGGYQEQQFYFDGLVTNGTFDTDLTGWTDVSTGTGTAVYDAGTVLFTSSDSSNRGRVKQTLTHDAGAVLLISFDVSGNTGTGSAGVYVSGGDLSSSSAYGNGSHTIVATTTAANRAVQFEKTFAGECRIDNVSVFEVDSNDDVVHRMPKGWVPKDVFEDGLLQREGSAHDYEVVYDGFDYFVKPTVAPSATTQTCVIGVKA